MNSLRYIQWLFIWPNLILSFGKGELDACRRLLDDPENRKILDNNTDLVIKMIEKVTIRSNEVHDTAKNENEIVLDNYDENLRNDLEEMNKEVMELEEELNEATVQVHEQQSQVISNLLIAFGISMEPPHLNLLHFKLPLDNNYNRLSPDDMNGVLGHLALLTVHLGKVFGVELPFDLIPCRPLTYFKLSTKEHLMLYLDPNDTLGRGVAKFVTALGLFNFTLAWLASVLLPAEKVHLWNGPENLWAILHWNPAYEMTPPKASLEVALRETIHCWNLHTGDGVTAAIPIDRLERILHRNITNIRPSV